MKRVVFYFDGFNFYNGFKEKTKSESQWKDFYWIDFVLFCRQFLQEGQHELIQVHYFTAPPANLEKRSRQAALLNANRVRNPTTFSVHQGNYQDKHINCKICRKTFVVPEEKRTDVGIAVQMLLDCFNDKADLLVLVSADSDQIPTLQTIKKFFPAKTVKVYFPPARYSTEVFQVAKPVVFLRDNMEKFRRSIMPLSVVSLDNNKIYTRPLSWSSDH